MKAWKWTEISKASVFVVLFIPGMLFLTIRVIPAAAAHGTRLTIPALPVPTFLLPDTTTERIDEFVSQEVKRHGIPGLALALVDDKQIIFMKGYGKADQAGRLVTPATPFILASASKPLTAVAVMQLVEAGKVDLDAPVQRYIPEFTLADASAAQQITVRHLLLHTSGLPVTACDTRGNAGTLAEYVAELQTVEPAAPVGTQHIYCSGNYNLLGRIIEKVSGQAFGKYIQDHVFTPLDMRQSFTSESLAQDAGMAEGYQWLFGLPLPTHHEYNPSQLPSGYMISSAEDMSHFLISQINEGQYMGTSIVSADTVAAMQVPGTERGGEGGYGFGWVISPVGGVPAVWHDGVNTNYHSLVLMMPEQRRGVVVLMNSFGIVAYESAYKEIETGITQLLAGIEPAKPAQSLGNLYFAIDSILAVILALAVWPLARIRSWHHRLLQRVEAGHPRFGRASLRSMLEICFALAFLVGIRTLIVTGLGAQSWYEVFTVFPDFVSWMWLFAFVILLTGLIRMMLIVRLRRTQLPKIQQVLKTPAANS
jgi:CubicO group peptidase (beta-lactamase class C family)